MAVEVVARVVRAAEKAVLTEKAAAAAPVAMALAVDLVRVAEVEAELRRHSMLPMRPHGLPAGFRNSGSRQRRP